MQIQEWSGTSVTGPFAPLTCNNRINELVMNKRRLHFQGPRLYVLCPISLPHHYTEWNNGLNIALVSRVYTTSREYFRGVYDGMIMGINYLGNFKNIQSLIAYKLLNKINLPCATIVGSILWTALLSSLYNGLGCVIQLISDRMKLCTYCCRNSSPFLGLVVLAVTVPYIIFYIRI